MPNKIEDAVLELDQLFSGYYLIDRDSGVFAVSKEYGENYTMHSSDLNKKMLDAHKLDIDVELFRGLFASKYVPGIIQKRLQNFDISILERDIIKKEQYRTYFFKGEPAPLETVQKRVKEINEQFPEEYVVIRRKETSLEHETIQLQFYEAFRILGYEDENPYYIMKMSGNNNLIPSDEIKDYYSSLFDIRNVIDDNVNRNKLMEFYDINKIETIIHENEDKESVFKSIDEFNTRVMEAYNKYDGQLYDIEEKKKEIIDNFKKDTEILKLSSQITPSSNFKL